MKLFEVIDPETEVTEEKFYELGLKQSLYELALAIQDEEDDIEAELQGDATHRCISCH